MIKVETQAERVFLRSPFAMQGRAYYPDIMVWNFSDFDLNAEQPEREFSFNSVLFSEVEKMYLLLKRVPPETSGVKAGQAVSAQSGENYFFYFLDSQEGSDSDTKEGESEDNPSHPGENPNTASEPNETEKNPKKAFPVGYIVLMVLGGSGELLLSGGAVPKMLPGLM